MLRRRIRIAPLLTGILALAAAGIAQTPLPSAPGTTPTLKANAQLVVVDVVVTDSKHNPVHNLKAGDFTLLENGAAQQITGFEEHAAAPSTQAAKAVPAPKLPPGIFTNFAPAPPGSAVNVLLLDALNTHMKDQSYVMDQLREFLKNTPGGTRIAIFILNDRLTMLQGFTSDLALLKAVAARPNLGSSMLLGDSAGHADNVGNGGTQTGSEVMSSIAGDDMAELIVNFQQAEATLAAQATMDRAKQTLDAMNQLAHYLAGIPGRKNLIWFSGSFPITIFPDSTIAHPFSVVASAEDEFRETTNLLGRAQVAVYPIDARGLQTFNTPIAKDSGPANAGMGLAMAQNKMFQDNANEHVTMNQMADATGGHAYVDDNGLSAAVAKAMENGSNYYTLSYTPSDSRQNGAFHKIQMKLAQPGATLNYRSGYYADEPEGKHTPAPEYSKGNTPSAFTRAMVRGSPTATEILLKLQVLPVNNLEEASVVPGNVLVPNPATKTKVAGPYRRYAIDIAADPHDVRITKTPDGHYEFLAEVVTFVYDVNGNLLSSAQQKAHGYLTPSSLANMLHVGLPFHQEISVPTKESCFLRTSVHDLETDRIGAVEVPVAAVAGLAPLAAAGGAESKPAAGAKPR